jgi:2-dehydro-3-deoxyphosphogluconate aldolase / (4S)-4-hydroxy-2-oxoglutarate aldolase
VNVLSSILKNKIVAIIRGAEPKNVLPIVNALFDGGIKLVEITLNSSMAFELIRDSSALMKNKMLIGAGTVLDVKSAKMAINNGAQFVISPGLNMKVMEFMKKQTGIVNIPGAFTPTEIIAAHQAGAAIVKVFPALSVQYIKDLRGPLSHIPLMPTGGIDLGNIQQFQKAGATAFGIGNSLVNANQPITKESLRQITQKAVQFVHAISAEG